MIPDIFNIFYETYIEYKKKHKTKFVEETKHSIRDIFYSLYQFTQNNVYFTRFSGKINGKYLNEIHNFLAQYNFYDTFYAKLLTYYTNETKGETLDVLATDSTFIRNIQNYNLNDRNPQYYNKPGFKIQVIVDCLKTPISVLLVPSTENDSLALINLVQNIMVDNQILNEKRNQFLMDTGYESIINTDYLSNQGYEVYSGYNKPNSIHVTKNTRPAPDTIVNKYKSRGIVENAFAIMQRCPCIINCYEKTVVSYKGLLMFVLAVALYKKTIKIIEEKKNIEIMVRRDALNEKKRNDALKRKEKRKELKKIKKDEHDARMKDRANKALEIKNIFMRKVYDIKDEKAIDDLYNKYIENKYKKRNTRKNKQTAPIKCISYELYKQKINDVIFTDIVYNSVYSIYTYNFGGKTRKIIHIKSHAFNDDSITNALVGYDWAKKVNNFGSKILKIANNTI